MESIKRFAGAHPQITSWIVLAIGMVIILVWSAREVGFTPGQWVALVITTILLAGACVWIIGWEDEEEEVAPQQVVRPEDSPVETNEQVTGEQGSKVTR